MAIICTNNLTGNDSTGNGSTATPYKTIAKALAVAASGDEIRVAGGQWTTLSGDFTFTNSSATVNTSVSQIGSVAANDVITFEDGQYGFDKFHYRVTAVTASTLTLGASWVGPTQVVSGISKLNAIHYTAAESWANPNSQYQPNGRTNITVSGGWNSDYTSNANGWTQSRSTSAMITIPNTAGNQIGDWRQNLFFDKFIAVQGGFIQLVAPTTAADENSFSVGKISFINQSGNGEFNNFFNKNFGLYNLNSSTPVELLVTQAAQFRSYFANSVAANNPTASSETKVTMWASLGQTVAGGYNATLQAVMATKNAGIMGSANKVTAHYRKSYVSAATAFYGNVLNFYTLIPTTTGIGYSYYFDKLNLYCNLDSVWIFNTPPGTYTQIEDVEFVGPAGSSGQNSLSLGEVGQILIDLSAEGKIIEDFKPTASLYGYGYTFGAGVTGSFDILLNTVCQTNLSMNQVKDAEGLKTMDAYGNIYFKDFVNNWLRVSSSLVFNNLGEEIAPSKVWKVIGVKEKVNAPFTVTFRLKDDGNSGGWDTIGVQYGPNPEQIVTASVSLTESFTDYYITIDPTTIADWNKFTFPLYFGIASGIKNVNSSDNTITHCFVESVTIS